MYEVHKNIKDGYENKYQFEHKRYVREKIESIKNKTADLKQYRI